jgi:hypothetical protein
MRIARTLRSLLFVAAAGWLTASAFAQQAGDQIVAVRDGAPLRSGLEKIGTIPEGSILVVRKAHGNRIWVALPADMRTVRGWVSGCDTIPFSQALDFYDKKVKRNPSARGYAIRGSIRERRGEYKQAITDYIDAIELDRKEPTNDSGPGVAWLATTEYRKGLARARGDDHYALAHFAEAMRLDPSFSDIYFGRTTLCMAGRTEEALANYNEAIGLHSRNPLVYFARGKLLQARGGDYRALVDFNEAIRLDPNLAPAYCCRATIWRTKGLYEAARSDYREAQRLDPELRSPFTVVP